MIFTATQLAEVLHGTVDGDPAAEASSFARIENGKKGNLCFFANPKYEQYVYSSHPSILLVNKDFQPKGEVTATMIRVDNAYGAITELLDFAARQRKSYKCRRSLLRSRIALSAKLGRRVWVGDFVTIGAKTTVGECTRICDNVTIGEGCRIGHHCLIYPGVRIYAGTVIGDRCILHENCVVGSDGFGNAPQSDGSWKKIEHLGNVIVGNDVEIGACATIDRAEMESTVIEDGCRIDNLCMVAHNVRVGKNTAMAAQSGIAGSTQIGEGCIMAGQSGVVGHIKVAPHTTIAAKTGIIGNIRTPGQTYVGMPGILHKNFMRSYALFKKAGEEK